MLVESVKYGAINTTNMTTNVFYVIMFTSEEYTLQDNTTNDGEVINTIELVVKSQYIFSMQVETNLYWHQNSQHHIITVPTKTILHPRPEVNAITDINEIPKIIQNSTQ